MYNVIISYATIFTVLMKLVVDAVIKVEDHPPDLLWRV